jgi:Carboxypeptidase regulatory-like domain
VYRTIAVISIGLCFTAVLFGQAFSSISGNITDPTGAVVPGAEVSLLNTQTGVARSTLSDERGRYTFAQVAPATYQVTAKLQGFQDVVAKDVRLLVNTPTTLNLRFENVGAVSTEVLVSAEAEQVNTTDATIGNSLGGRAITELPFEARNVVGLLAIQPGVVYLGEPDPGDLNDSRSGAVNGGKSDQANVTLDGVDANDVVSGAAFKSVLRVTLDSVQEFRTITTNAGAEMGRSSGAQVALVTKSGTNAFHGSVYEFVRNTATSANSFFNNASGVEKPKLNRNVFGGSIGGPIQKNRLFFFLNYEGRRDTSQSTALRIVPLESFKKGTFTYLTKSGAIAQLTPDQVKQLDPQGIGESAAVLADLQSFPVSNDTTVGDGLNTGGFRFNAATPLRWNTYIAKLDYVIDSAGKHQIFWRGNLQNDNYANGIPQFPGEPASSVFLENSKGFAVGYTGVLSNSTVNSFHYGLTREGTERTGVLNSPYVFFQSITPLHATTLGNALTSPVHTIADDLVITKGSHTLSVGGVGRLNSLRTVSTPAPSFGETYSIWFEDDGTGLLPADAKVSSPAEAQLLNLMGIVSLMTTNQQLDKSGDKLPLGTLVDRTWKQNVLELYAQDAWKMKRSLTVTGGVRLSFAPAVHEVNGYQISTLPPLSEVFDKRVALAASGQPQSLAPAVSFDLYGKPGTTPLWAYQKTVAPRLALAYSPEGTAGLAKFLFGGPGRTSIRAGAGLYYDAFGMSVARNYGDVQFGLSTRLRNKSNQPASALPRYTGFYSPPLDQFPIAPSGAFPQTHPNTGGNERGYDDSLKSPYTVNMNVTIGRELPGGLLFEVSYVGRESRRSLIGTDMMNPTNLVDSKSGLSYFQAAQMLGQYAIDGTPVENVPKIAYWENLWPGAAGNGLTATQGIYKAFDAVHGDYTTALLNIDSACKPSCSIFGPNAMYSAQYNALTAYRSMGKGSYNGMEMSLRKRFSQGYQFDVNYTWSKCFDLASRREADSPGGGLINPFDPNEGWGLCDYDIGHVASGLGVVELPFGRGKLIGANSNPIVDQVIGGWQLGTIFRMTSGLVTRVDNGVGWPTTWCCKGYATQTGGPFVQSTTKDAPAPASGGRPGPNLFPDPAAAFAAYSWTLPGKAGQRNGIRGDGAFGIDLSLAKRFKVTEDQSLQFRAEAFNVTNSVRFDPASVNLSLSNAARFGQYTQVLTLPRVFQFSLRYEF